MMVRKTKNVKSKYAIRYNINAETFKKLYIEQNKSLDECAAEMNVSKAALFRFKRNNGISKQRFNKDNIILREGERICPICKRKFYKYSENWVYKRATVKKTIYFCSYNCMRMYDKEHKRYHTKKH